MQRLNAQTGGERQADDRKNLCRFPVDLVLVGLLTIAAYFLWTEHRSHVIAGLPYLLLLACPLMLCFTADTTTAAIATAKDPKRTRSA